MSASRDNKSEIKPENRPESVFLGMPSIASFTSSTQKKFLTHGINTKRCDADVYVILYTIQNAEKRANIILNYFAPTLPSVLTQIIFDYLNIDLYKKYIAEIANLIPLTGSPFIHFQPKNDNKSVAHFLLPLNKKQGELIAYYFNQIKEDSANLIEKKSQNNEEQINQNKKNNSYIELAINLETLTHSSFQLDLDDTIKTLPQDILDQFRKESQTISFTTAECLQKLNTVKQIIQEKKISSDLLSKIDELTECINKHGLEQEEHKRKRESLVEGINALKVDLPGPPLKKLKYWLFSVFSSQNSTINILEKNIDEALDGIDFIASKRFNSRRSQ
jgi:hypothetical protein